MICNPPTKSNMFTLIKHGLAIGAATLVYILIKLILASTQINLELILHVISISKLSGGWKTDLPTKVLVIWAVEPTDFWCDKQII